MADLLGRRPGLCTRWHKLVTKMDLGAYLRPDARSQKLLLLDSMASVVFHVAEHHATTSQLKPCA